MTNTGREFSKTIIKGSPEYTVTEGGTEIARAHCVQVKSGRFTLVIDGRWAGVGTEQQVVAKLSALAEGC